MQFAWHLLYNVKQKRQLTVPAAARCMAGGARKEETMKKLMALVTALLLICTLAACGGAPLKKPSEQDTLALLRQVP